MSGLYEPGWNDAVMGGDNPAPNQAAVLGGLWQVQQRLGSEDLGVKFAAMRDCLKYGEAGVAEVIPFLEDALPRLQFEAYQLLRSRSEESVKLALTQYKFWRHFERLDGLPDRHALSFSNRRTAVFDPKIGIQDTVNTAYAIRANSEWGSGITTIENISTELLLDPNVNQIESLTFGHCYSTPSHKIVIQLVKDKIYLPNLRAVFIGDIKDQEQMISSIEQSDISPILEAYPNLEILHIRGGGGYWRDASYFSYLEFSQLKHNNLLALRVESGGLNRKAISGICSLELPALEYLELWLGSSDYGGDSSVEDLMPIISGEAFPNLKYLGLRNCEYTDHIAFALVQSPLMNQLIELDFSLGSLTERGMAALLNCPSISFLDTLNIAQCSVGQNNPWRSVPVPSFSELDVRVIADGQRYLPRQFPEDEEDYDEYDQSSYRYCVVAE
jgi:hypothetical protein